MLEEYDRRLPLVVYVQMAIPRMTCEKGSKTAQ